MYDAEARNCRNIKKLNVRGLQNVNEKEIVESEAFKALMSQLTILELYIVTEYEDACPENSYDKPELFTFFEELPSIWLEPTVSNLSTLTLYCDNIFGWCPLLDLRNVHFPQLKNLHLGNYSFTMDWQFDWILSHSTTLKKLTFDDCPITYHMRIPVNGAREQEMYSVNEFKDVERPENPSDYWILKYNKRWNSVFDLFRAKLTNLEVFIFGHTRSWGSGIPWRATARRRLKSVMYAEMYMTFDKGLGPSPWINQKWHFDVPEDGEYPFKVCKKEDKMALEELMEDVKRRSGVKYRPIIEIDAEEDEMSDREEDDKEDEAIYITRMERAKAQPEEDDSDSEDSEDSENDG